MSRPHAEGVIKFESLHRVAALDERAVGAVAVTLAGWRATMARLGVLGQDPARYGGLGFGNVSARLEPGTAQPRGARRFLVTASQTGALARVTLADLCVVERWDLERNRIESMGPLPPSSESLTHGALYDAVPAIGAVLHGHAPRLWREAEALGLPVTAADVAYGTPAMAREVQRVLAAGAATACGVLAMGGHEDGVIAYGATADEAGAALVAAFARAEAR